MHWKLILKIFIFSNTVNTEIIKVEIIKEKLKDEDSNSEDIQKLFDVHKEQIISQISEISKNENQSNFWNNSIKALKLMYENQDKITVDESDPFFFKNNKNNLVEINKDRNIKNAKIISNDGMIPDYKIPIIFIPTDPILYKAVMLNYNLLEQIDTTDFKRKIKGISVYKDKKTNKNFDFWRRVEFIEKDGKFIDKTGVFEGIMKNSFENLLNSSKLENFGFFVDQSISKQDVEINLYLMKLILSEIANLQKETIENVLKRTRGMGIFDEIIFEHEYPLKSRDVIEVCICNSDYCTKPCEEIRKVERKYLRKI